MGARWTEADWLEICTQAYKDNPAINIDSKEFRDVKKEYLLAAMKKVIEPARWHDTINMTNSRPKIVEAMEHLKWAIRGSKDKLHQRTASRAEEILQLQAVQRKTEAIKPFIDSVAEGLFLSIQPMLEKYLESRLSGAAEGVAIKEAIKPVLATPRALRIGIIGLLPIQYQEIIKGFPNLDIEYAEGNARKKDVIPQMKNCDMIFGLIGKMNHGAEHWLPREKFTIVTGGTTSMRRNIEMWLATIT